MTSNSTIGRSKWIAAAVAMIFMVSAAAVCLDAAYAAGDEEPETFDVDETFTSIFGIISFLFIEEPSDDATVISNDHDVNHSEEYDDLVLKDGAVLNFNNGAVLSADRLFIEGNVKFVNADGSKPRLFAESVFLEGCRCLLTDTALTTDKSVTVDAKKTTTGFYDPSSGTLDPSKGMKESLDAKIYIDGYMELSGKTQAKFYSGNGSPAVEFYADYDLDGFYKSLKDNLDGMVMDASSVSKVVDYLANKLVYPDIDLGMKVAKATAGSATVSDVSVTFVSSQADGDIAFGLNVGSSEGDFECEKLVLNAVRSLEKTDISGSADRLVSKSAGSNIGAAKQTAEFRNLKFSFSTEEDKVLEIVAANIADGPQAVIDALSDSDAEISGNSSIQVGSVDGSGPVVSDGVVNNVVFHAEGVDYRSDVDTKTGTAVKGSADVLDYRSEGNASKQTMKLTDFAEDLTTDGKNVFSILKFVHFDENDDDSAEMDYRAALLDYLDGLAVKGDFSVGTLEQTSVSGTEGVDYKESATSITGDSKKNFWSTVDAKFSADKDAERIGLVGTFAPVFSSSAVGYSKSLVCDASGVDGNEVTMKNISLDVQTLKVETTLDDIMDKDKLADGTDMKVAVKADVVKSSWSTGEGNTAYAEKVDMRKASFDTNVVDLANFTNVDLPASAGESMRIDSYKVSDRGTDPMMSFADVVAKADSSSSIIGSSYEYKYDASGKESLYIADTETIINGADVKYKETSDVDSVAYLVKNEAGYYEVTTDSSADSVPVYNVEGKSPGKSGDNTMIYIAAAIIALIVIALIAYFLLKKRKA